MQNDGDLKKIGSVLLRMACYSAVLFVAAKIIEVDMLKQSVREGSFTECSQEILVFLTAVVAAVVGFMKPRIRALAYVFSAIALVSLIREMDAFLESNLFDNAWQLFAIIVILPTLWFAYKNLSKLINQFYDISITFSFGLILVGAIILHVFSRLFGRASVWKALMTEEKYIRAVKDTAEEGTELLGYAIIFMGVIELALLFSTRKKEQAN